MTPRAPSERASTTTSVGTIEGALTHLVRLAEPRQTEASADEPRALDRAAYAVMTRITELAPVRLTELAQVMDIDISTASRQVRALEVRNFVLRTGDPADQRSRFLEPSPEGLAALEATRACRLSWITSRLEHWEADDLNALAGLLDRLVESFRSVTETPYPLETAGATR